MSFIQPPTFATLITGLFLTLLDIIAALNHRLQIENAWLEAEVRELLARRERQQLASPNFCLPALMRSAVAPSIAALVERTFQQLSRN